MQAIDRPTPIELSMKQENQESLELVDDDAANLHVSRSQIFFWELLSHRLLVISRRVVADESPGKGQAAITDQADHPEDAIDHDLQHFKKHWYQIR